MKEKSILPLGLTSVIAVLTGYFYWVGTEFLIVHSAFWPRNTEPVGSLDLFKFTVMAFIISLPLFWIIHLVAKFLNLHGRITLVASLLLSFNFGILVIFRIVPALI